MHGFENHRQWTAVKETVERLKGAGFAAVLAGGCVRDLLLGRQPNDFDIATDATPDQVESLFEKSIAVGKAFGVIILPFEGFQLEVATFREDLEYRDGRRPEGVRFATMEADAKRRDFTINALFYDVETKAVFDFVEGQKDLQRKVIRAVGDPDRRFDEDKLRLLRAVRFAAQMDFPIESTTLRAVENRASEVRIVSFERIRDELQKLLKQPPAGRERGLDLLVSTGLLTAIFSDFVATDVWREALRRLRENAPVAVSLAVFLSPLFTGRSERDFRDQILRSLKLDNKTSEAVLFSLRHQNVFTNPEMLRRGEMALLLAKSEAETATEVSQMFGAQSQAAIDRFRNELFDQAGQLPKPFVSGDDLVRAGMKRGPQMGAVLNTLYLNQIEGAYKDREAALKDIARLQDQKPS